MNWPWKTEQRNDSYTDNLVSLFTGECQRQNHSKTVMRTGALESCAGLVSRCFSAIGGFRPGSRARGARSWDTLGQIGRALIRSGEIVYYLDVQGRRVMMLLPC